MEPFAFNFHKNRGQTEFKCLFRNEPSYIVLITGWAADYRVFNTLDIKYNYLLPVNFDPATFEKKLMLAMKENDIKKISLFGWSLGGFLAAEFAGQHADIVEELILVSVREKYNREDLAEIRGLLKKNKKVYLYKFYAQCFYQKENMKWFKKNLLKEYCESFDLNYLLDTLDYLENSEIKACLLKEIKKIKIVHGEYDNIAPIQEARRVSQDLTQAEFIRVREAGHIPFLKEDLSGYICSIKK